MESSSGRHFYRQGHNLRLDTPAKLYLSNRLLIYQNSLSALGEIGTTVKLLPYMAATLSRAKNQTATGFRTGTQKNDT